MWIDELRNKHTKIQAQRHFRLKDTKLPNQVQKDKNTTLYAILSFSFLA
jgi:hypothetical protein